MLEKKTLSNSAAEVTPNTQSRGIEANPRQLLRNEEKILKKSKFGAEISYRGYAFTDLRYIRA